MRFIRPTWGWGIASAVLVLATGMCTVLATVIVDALLIRPMPASVNTLLPGWTYGAVAVLKVCLTAGVGAGLVYVFDGVRRRWFPTQALAARVGSARTAERDVPKADAFTTTVPVMSIVSVVLPSVTPLM